jgi:hypothetical protein
MKLLRRNRADFLRQNLAVCEREKSVYLAVMRSDTTTPLKRKQAFTRYSAAVMGMRKIRSELRAMISA